MLPFSSSWTGCKFNALTTLTPSPHKFFKYPKRLSATFLHHWVERVKARPTFLPKKTTKLPGHMPWARTLITKANSLNTFFKSSISVYWIKFLLTWQPMGKFSKQLCHCEERLWTLLGNFITELLDQRNDDWCASICKNITFHGLETTQQHNNNNNNNFICTLH